MRYITLLCLLIAGVLVPTSTATTAPGWIVQQISSGGYVNGDASVQLSGESVAWREYVGGKYRMMFWDGTTARLISDPNSDCDVPAISGGSVTWREFTASGMRIMLYDGTTHLIRQAAANTCGNPRISGDNVVWCEQVGGIYSIMLWNGVATTQISSGGHCGQPVISGNNAAWTENGGT
jgi:hypothetical protein